MAWHSGFDNYGHHPSPRNAGQGTRLRVPSIGRVRTESIIRE
jgi:hypothetical protein